MAAKFEPRPERSTASRTSLDPRCESCRRRVVDHLAASLHHVADEVELLPDLAEVASDGVDLVLRGDDHHSYAHVEDAQHLVAGDVSVFGEIAEDRQHRPGAELDVRV